MINGLFNRFRNLYVRLLISFTFIIIVLITSLSAVLYFNYEKSAKINIYQSNEQALGQISFSASYMNEIANKFILSAFVNSDIESLMFSNTEDRWTINKAIYTLDALITPNSYIQSVYIYNQGLNMFLSSETGSQYTSKDFYDQGIVQLLSSKNKSQFNLKPIPRKIVSADLKAQSNVYTYVLYNMSREGGIDSAIVLNISSDWLRDTIGSFTYNAKDAYKSDIYILDSNGVVINQANQQNFMKDISTVPYVHKILTDNHPTDIIIATIEGKKFAVTYVSSNVLDWKFVSLTPYLQYIHSMQNLKKLTFLICGLVLLFGGFFSFVITRKVYSPIQVLVKHIKLKLSVGNKDSGPDEVKFLSNVFNYVIDKADTLDEMKRKDSSRIKNELLMVLLVGSKAFTNDQIRKQAEGWNFQIEIDSHMCMAILQIDQYRAYTEKYHEQDRELLAFAIINISSEVLFTVCKHEIVNIGRNQLVIIMNRTDQNEPIHTLMSEIQRNVLQYLKISLTISIGNDINDISELNMLYEETLNLLNYRIKYGHGSLLTTVILLNLSKEPFQFPVSKEKSMLKFLRLGDLEQTKSAYLEMIKYIEAYSYEHIISSVMNIAFTVYNDLAAIKENSQVSLPLNYNSFFSEISNLETLEGINQTFTSLFEEAIGRMKDNKGSRTHHIVNHMMTIIKEKFSESNLNLNSIADLLDMSAVYIGKLFRDVTNKSVSEYLTEVRMEHVLYKLDHTALSIQEIIESSGFERSNYFYTLFKKHTGVSLNEYKLKQKTRTEIE